MSKENEPYTIEIDNSTGTVTMNPNGDKILYEDRVWKLTSNKKRELLLKNKHTTQEFTEPINAVTVPEEIRDKLDFYKAADMLEADFPRESIPITVQEMYERVKWVSKSARIDSPITKISENKFELDNHFVIENNIIINEN